MKEEDLRKQFPRCDSLPTQSSKFWVKEKDRYIRQLLISDIESETGRKLIVYFAKADMPMTRQDSEDLSEILEGIEADKVDLMLQTPGGEVTAVEKYVTVLQQQLKNGYRVIVPNFAKSGGTLICLSSEKILLGVNSELGPIDPQMNLQGIGSVPCEFISKDETLPPTLRELARNAAEGSRNLARNYLSQGMLKEQGKKRKIEIDQVIKKISSPNSYSSHSSVIDYSEANELGLSVDWMEPDSNLWKRIWLLYCAYDFDMELRGIATIQEGARYSMSRHVRENRGG